MKNIRVLYEERASKGCNVDILTIRLEEVLSSTLEEIKESLGSVYDVYATKDIEGMEYVYGVYVQIGQDNDNVSCVIIPKEMKKCLEEAQKFIDAVEFYKFVKGIT